MGKCKAINQELLIEKIEKAAKIKGYTPSTFCKWVSAGCPSSPAQGKGSGSLWQSVLENKGSPKTWQMLEKACDRIL